MQHFRMCSECDYEYHDPLDRRFHAQPNACPKCGPQVELWDRSGKVRARRRDALDRLAELVREGKIIALKGLGGFQLIADARNEAAVVELRARKRREEKPFALMYPSVEMAQDDCQMGDLEQRLLLSPECPIVLLRRRTGPLLVAPQIAPGNPMLGVMLPCTPLHHILMRDLGFPIVATSGNLTDEPICTDEHEALDRLNGLADFFLVHNRPIQRPMDDSIVQVVHGREMVMRRARGYAPLPVHLKTEAPAALAVGAHLKNTVALARGHEVFISQHIGDLETAQAWAVFRNMAADLPGLYETDPGIVACDLHPEYLSTQYACQLGAEVHHVQHHWAHVLSCMADNELEGPVLGVAWDGTGFGPDGTIWGGEFLVPAGDSFERFAHLRQFRLPGGEAAIKQPRRTALGLLHEIYGDSVFQREEIASIHDFPWNELALIRQLLAKGFQAPLTSSAGRLFDGVASLLDLRQQSSFEGQAAMALEFAASGSVVEAYPFRITGVAPLVLDWQPMVEHILEEIDGGESSWVVAAKFHNTLVEMIVAVAERAGRPKVVLTGGCFQNRLLLEKCIESLTQSGFQPYWHQRVPSNDGGIALGQVVALCRTSHATQTSHGAPARETVEALA
jgi:hydrogenase maturation protein HypF